MICTDDDLARLALTAELTPEARQVMALELQLRGLKDLSAFRQRIQEDADLTNPDRYAQVTSQIGQRMDRAMAGTALMLGAWILAVGLPVRLWNSDPSEPLGPTLLFTGLGIAIVALSIYRGLRARQEQRWAIFYLNAVVPLVLLCASMIFTLITHRPHD
jgi:hypothetical protein